MTEELWIEYTMNDLVDIFGEHIRKYFIVGTSHSWLLDIYTMGEAAMCSAKLPLYLQEKDLL
ncbi:MAG: monoamine oxidase [Saprospiraceae bacterium]